MVSTIYSNQFPARFINYRASTFITYRLSLANFHLCHRKLIWITYMRIQLFKLWSPQAIFPPRSNLGQSESWGNWDHQFPVQFICSGFDWLTECTLIGIFRAQLGIYIQTQLDRAFVMQSNVIYLLFSLIAVTGSPQRRWKTGRDY